MRMTRSIVGRFVFAVVCVVLLPRCEYFGLSNKSRAELVQFEKQLQLGETKDEVRQRYSAARLSRLKLRESVGGNHNEWVVETPLQFGAGNWLLWLEFKEGRLSAVRVREEDNTLVKPRDAPPDRALATVVSPVPSPQPSR